MRDFHLGDILSITTGRLVSPTHMDGIYAILNYMTGDDLFTHQIPRAATKCAPFLLQQYPQLAGVDASGVNPDNWQQWLAEQVALFAEYLPVAPLPKGAHQFIGPIRELTDMVGEDKVIVVGNE